MSRCHSASLCVLFMLTLTAARGQLVLTNFSPANPLKVMAVGDSITDDCVFNGAWRLYLQPLLETNSYAFTFVGRQTSVPVGNFTKTMHEAYCGAVIAPPGIYAAHGYVATNSYLERIVADALTNITPDLVLVLIGVNDIGHGRDPWLTATNDMSNLLGLIFSNAPNASVIIAKVTSIAKASDISGLNYSFYLANVPIYNASLQALVNQRRAAGQNVFLADMFSGVNTSTMLLSDGLHPNASGLQAIAQEWLTRIQSISVCTNLVVSMLVKGGEDWKYSDTGVDLGTNWVSPDYDDSGWSNGPARLGYGEKAAATTVSFGLSSTNKNPTTYFRHTFIVPENVTFTNAVLRLAQEPGVVAWLNGHELWRTNLPAGPIAYTNLALSPPASFDAPYIFHPVTIDASKLLRGTNVIAVELHQVAPTFRAIGFDLEVIGTGHPALPALSLALTGTNLVFAWPADSGGGFRLYSSTNLTPANWQPVAVTPQTNGTQVMATQALDMSARFFRLQKP
jgi:lysophospholipase L1-like esterase